MRNATCVDTQISMKWTLRRVFSKGRFPFQPYRTETYRISLFPSTKVELMVSTQKKILRYVTIRLKWKPALRRVLNKNRVSSCSYLSRVVKKVQKGCNNNKTKRTRLENKATEIKMRTTRAKHLYVTSRLMQDSRKTGSYK